MNDPLWEVSEVLTAILARGPWVRDSNEKNDRCHFCGVWGNLYEHTATCVWPRLVALAQRANGAVGE